MSESESERGREREERDGGKRDFIREHDLRTRGKEHWRIIISDAPPWIFSQIKFG